MTNPSPLSVYWDANAFIHLFETEGSELTEMMQRAVDRELRLCTSELTLAEVLVVPIRTGQIELVQRYEALISSRQCIIVAPVDRQVLRRSAEVRARFGGKGADAIHIATAAILGCSIFVSDDIRVRLPANLKRLRISDAARLGSQP